MPLTLFAIPDQAGAETNHFAIEMPCARQPDPDPRPRTARCKGLKDWPPDERAAGRDPVLRLPHHGRHRPADAAAGRARAGGCAGAARLFDSPLVPALLPVRRAARLRRRDRRLDDDRGRPPALDRLRPDAHGRLGVAVAHRRATCCSRCSATWSSISIIFPAGVLVMLRIVRQGPGGGRSRRADRERPAAAGRSTVQLPAERRGVDGRRPRLRADLDRDPRRSASSSTCCSTASISASASSTASRPTPTSRNLMMNSIAPIWDGNETWLVLGGVALLAAFPLAFAIIIPALYFPILVMLLALIFRGVAFEFRFRDSEHRTLLGPRLLLSARRSRPSRRAWCSAPSSRASRSTGAQFAGSSLRLPHAVLAADRHRAGVRLRPARRRLADPQDRGRAPGLGAPHGADAASSASLVGDRRGQPLDAVRQPARSPRAGSPGPTSLFLAPVPIATAALPCWSGARLHGTSRGRRRSSARSACSLLSYLGIAISLWPMIVPLQVHAVGGRLVAKHAGLPAGRHAVPAAGHPDLHRLVLLGVPRQGARRHRLSSLKSLVRPRPSGASRSALECRMRRSCSRSPCGSGRRAGPAPCAVRQASPG